MYWRPANNVLVSTTDAELGYIYNISHLNTDQSQRKNLFTLPNKIIKMTDFPNPRKGKRQVCEVK